MARMETLNRSSLVILVLGSMMACIVGVATWRSRQRATSRAARPRCSRECCGQKPLPVAEEVSRRPGAVPAGATSAQPWAFWDVLPTLAELAGVDVLPADDLDGASIAPLLRGERSDDEPPRYLYFTWTGAGAPYGYAARRGRYKGVVPNCTDAPAADDAWELYDLIDDPFETRDLAPAGGDEPQTALADLRAWVLAGNFSCECFQC